MKDEFKEKYVLTLLILAAGLGGAWWFFPSFKQKYSDAGPGIPRQTQPPFSNHQTDTPARFLEVEFGVEYAVIMAAAARNECKDIPILFAIRKAENGGPGIQFGIECQRGTDLDTQAGWAAATIVKNRARWDGQGEFIDFLASRYCPLNSEVWAYNVKFWVDKIERLK